MSETRARFLRTKELVEARAVGVKAFFEKKLELVDYIEIAIQATADLDKQYPKQSSHGRLAAEVAATLYQKEVAK